MDLGCGEGDLTDSLRGFSIKWACSLAVLLDPQPIPPTHTQKRKKETGREGGRGGREGGREGRGEQRKEGRRRRRRRRRTRSLLPWSTIFSELWKIMVPRKFNETYFLLLHRALHHGDRAYRYDLKYPPNWDCNYCDQPETLLHIFYECTLAQHLWNFIKRTWKNHSGLSPPTTAIDILSDFVYTPVYPIKSIRFRLLAILHRSAIQVMAGEMSHAPRRHHLKIRSPGGLHCRGKQKILFIGSHTRFQDRQGG